MILKKNKEIIFWRFIYINSNICILIIIIIIVRICEIMRNKLQILKHIICKFIISHISKV